MFIDIEGTFVSITKSSGPFFNRVRQIIKVLRVTIIN